MKETKNDYQGNLSPVDCYNSVTYNSWEHFKLSNTGFRHCDEFNDSELFIFRYDIDRYKGAYSLKLYTLWQTQGKYVTIYVDGITQKELDTVVKSWLLRRRNYLAKMWNHAL